MIRARHPPGPDRLLSVAEQQVGSPAAMSSRNIGSRNTSSAMVTTDLGLADGSSLTPPRQRRAAGSTLDRPISAVAIAVGRPERER
jgi:hypothetical protein